MRTQEKLRRAKELFFAYVSDKYGYFELPAELEKLEIILRELTSPSQTIEEHEDYMLLWHIADQAECNICYPAGFPGERSNICSKHRDPVLLAQGHLKGWQAQGGMPNV